MITYLCLQLGYVVFPEHKKSPQTANLQAPQGFESPLWRHGEFGIRIPARSENIDFIRVQSIVLLLCSALCSIFIAMHYQDLADHGTFDTPQLYLPRFYKSDNIQSYLNPIKHHQTPTLPRKKNYFHNPNFSLTKAAA